MPFFKSAEHRGTSSQLPESCRTNLVQLHSNGGGKRQSMGKSLYKTGYLLSPHKAGHGRHFLLIITKKAIVCQRNFSTRSWVCFGSFSAGIRGIFGLEVERGCFQRFGKARQVFLRLIRAHRFLPPPSAYHKSKLSITAIFLQFLEAQKVFDIQNIYFPCIPIYIRRHRSGQRYSFVNRLRCTRDQIREVA